MEKGWKFMVINRTSRLKTLGDTCRLNPVWVVLLFSPALYAGSGEWSAVEYDVAGNPYIYIDNYGAHEHISLMMKASSYDCSLEVSTFEFSPSGETKEPFVATHPRFRIDRKAVIDIPDLHYTVEYERDEDEGAEYAITSSQWVPNDQFMTGFVSGSKLIYSHDGIGTIRWSLRGSARRLSELYQKCSLTAIEEDEWGEDESFSDSEDSGLEWRS
jgi:hypothetical protein